MIDIERQCQSWVISDQLGLQPIFGATRFGLLRNLSDIAMNVATLVLMLSVNGLS